MTTDHHNSPMHHKSHVSSVLAPVLVGRDMQIAAVERLLASVAAGQAGPRVLLIRGEAGIGKSRLLAALRKRAIELDWRCIESACFEYYQSVPYAPISDLLHGSISSADDRNRALGGDADLLGLLPGFPRTSHQQTAEQQGAPRDLAQEQRQLFAALAKWFAIKATEYPLLLTIEDLHWSDTASLAFVPTLARALSHLPALVAVTLRMEDASPSLRATLTDLNRQRLATEIALSRLSRDEVATMVRACFQLQRPLYAEFLDSLYVLTDGNPFFIEEILTALVSTNHSFYLDNEWDRKPVDQLQIPHNIQEAVARRATLLSEAAREVLTLAAALGRHFDFVILHQVTGYDEATLLALIKELIAVQLVVEESADRFAFRHALGRAAVYGSLLARERRVLHRRLAEALEQANETVYVADLARHFTEAQVWDKALRYAGAAAEAAMAAYAPREAVIHLNAALGAARKLPHVAYAPLLHRRGQAHVMLDSFEAALADYEEALADARTHRRAADEWQALLDLGFLWSSRDYTRVGAYLEQMLDCARAIGDPARLARSLNRVGNWQLNLDRPYTARNAHREAYDIFIQLGDEHGLAETLGLLGLSNYLCGDLAAGTACFERAIALFEAHDNRYGLVDTLAHLSLRVEFDIEVIDLEHIGARSEPVERAIRLTRELGWRTGEAYALLMKGLHFIALGKYGPAQAALEISLTVAGEIEHHIWASQAQMALGLLDLELLQVPEATEQLTQAMDVANRSNSVLTMRDVARYLAAAYTEQQRFEEADEMLRHALTAPQEIVESSLVVRQLHLARAELALARGEPERALERIDALIGSTANLGTHVVPRLWLVRGEAYAALRRYAEAQEVLEAALTAAQARGQRPLVWRIWRALGHVALALRRRQGAANAFDAASLVVDELAASLSSSETADAFRAAARKTLAQKETLTPRQALKQVFDGLTDRELEVARLIARGYTNRQIAATLSLSERTVSTHIGNIYGKLGLTTRSQLTRWAIEKGISSF